MAVAHTVERSTDPGRDPGQSGGAAALPALDMHGGLSGNRPTGCSRWPLSLRLMAGTGKLIAGRCKASNLCEYCAMLASVEAAEMLALDAMVDAPTTLIVLTTRTATVDMAAFYEGRAQLVRALRKMFPGFQYASLVEFTTGYGPRSGGLRRPHWNFMCKGIPAAAHEAVREVVQATWCRCVDAESHAQHVGSIYAAGGLTKYLALHFLKESQKPPCNFTGQRFNCSQGYFAGRTRAEAREAAKESLRWKRALWRALRDGYEGEEAEVVASLEVAQAQGETWQCVAITREFRGLPLELVEVGGIARDRVRVMKP